MRYNIIRQKPKVGVMIKRLISRLFDEKLEFRLRIFNMLALGGIIIS